MAKVKVTMALLLTGLMVMSGLAMGCPEAPLPPPPEVVEPAPEIVEPVPGMIPEPFADPDRPIRIALVREVGEGAFFARQLAGAKSMARQLGIELLEATAGGDMLKMSTDIETFTRMGVDAIAISHGRTDALRPSIDKAMAGGIPVVTFDLAVGRRDVPQMEQDDLLIGLKISRQLAMDFGGEANVLYINVGGFAPLDRRDQIWRAIKWRFPDLNQLAQIGAVTGDTTHDTLIRTEAALKEHPETNAVLAMWDAFAKGAVRAIEEAGLADEIRVYSVDISTHGIGLMTAPGSPWVATVGTDSYSVGRLLVRTAAALVAGEEIDTHLLMDPVLITQEFLRENNITNMDELVQAMPALGESPLSWFPWMKYVLARNGYELPPVAREALGL